MSAKLEEYKKAKTKSSQAKIHGLQHVTPETFAYACLLVSFLCILIYHCADKVRLVLCFAVPMIGVLTVLVSIRSFFFVMIIKMLSADNG